MDCELYLSELAAFPMISASEQNDLARRFRTSVRGCEQVLDQFPAKRGLVLEVLDLIDSGKPTERYIVGADRAAPRAAVLRLLRERAENCAPNLADWHFRPSCIFRWCRDLLGLFDRLPNTKNEVEAKSKMTVEHLHQCVERLRPLLNNALDARNRLVEANLRLVVKLAQPFVGRGATFEDIVQEGSLGLTAAAEAYDPDAGAAKFSSFAAHWITGRILNWRRRTQYSAQIESLDEERSANEEGYTLHDRLVGQEGIVLDEHRELKNLVEKIFIGLNLKPQEERVVRLKFGLPLPNHLQPTIMLRVTREPVRQQQAKQFARMRATRVINLNKTSVSSD
jgi:RNA polymerase sigma factor (sigma-70 family)